ncbi:MAG: aspartyl/glutamyl-tRNA(Asn/Gln) amidotransferase subunit B [Phycisphaerae bacterium]|nr:MAG: aspartyl/glutamyl-tRNA(Asn/Gln) amidotransferase subunit B [Phycisphaerae bacterium]
MPTVVSSTTIIGLEVHVELATRRKMFSAAPSPAHREFAEAPPNTLLDPVVLGLPGALPVMNRAAVEMAMLVGLALGGKVAPVTRWDRKNYFYPDMPKAYQISQYDQPLCVGGLVEVPAADAKGFPDLDAPATRVRIVRAHLEEDAGKLLHEAPGGGVMEGSILDLNRAGAALLEIVTEPDFRSAEQVVLFAKLLRATCRFLGVTEGVMQQGHVRFEPNINCELTLDDGRTVRTPIVEVKNLNSFKAVRGAIEHEAREQPRRWMDDGRVMGPGTKTTRGWDDARAVTFIQRGKEDAHDYRYFPDPDLPPLTIDDAWREKVAARLGELPLDRLRRYVTRSGLPTKEAFALIEERDTCLFYEAVAAGLIALGMEEGRAGKVAANWVLGACAARANERGAQPHEVGIKPTTLAALGKLREDGRLNNQGTETLFARLCDAPTQAAPATDALAAVEHLAGELGVLVVRDDAAMAAWVREVLDANPKVVEDVRGGKAAAVGRLVGEVMKRAGGKADAKAVREALLAAIGIREPS